MSEIVTKPEIAKPTDNYRRVVAGDRDFMQRCWIVGHELVWRDIPVVDGEATDADRRG